MEALLVLAVVGACCALPAVLITLLGRSRKPGDSTAPAGEASEDESEVGPRGA